MKVFFLAATALCPLLSTSGQGSSFVPEGDSLVPFGLGRGTIVSGPSPPSALRIAGRNWDGSTSLLFEAPDPSGPAIAVAFAVGQDLRSLVLEERRGEEGWLAIQEIVIPADLGTSAEGRTAKPPMLPFHQARVGDPERAFDPRGKDAATIARDALSRLVVTPPPVASALVLLAACLLCAAVALPSVARRLSARRPALATLLATCATLALAFPSALALLPPKAELFVVTLAPSPQAADQSMLHLRQYFSRGFSIHTWGSGRGTRLIAARTPKGRPLPLGLFLGDNPNPRLSFDPPPLVSNLDGELFLSFPGLGLAWSIDDEP